MLGVDCRCVQQLTVTSYSAKVDSLPTGTDNRPESRRTVGSEARPLHRLGETTSRLCRSANLGRELRVQRCSRDQPVPMRAQSLGAWEDLEIRGHSTDADHNAALAASW